MTPRKEPYGFQGAGKGLLPEEGRENPTYLLCTCSVADRVRSAFMPLER